MSPRRDVMKCQRCDGGGSLPVGGHGLLATQPCPVCEGSGLIGTDGRDFWPVKKRERRP